MIAEIAAKTSWKINLRVFEIPEWIGSACLVWARVYLFSNCRRDRGHVDSIGICFVFRYRHREGALTAAAKKWDKPETAACSPSRGNQKSALVPSPSNMFYNLLPWCGVLCVLFFNHYFHWTTVQVLCSPSGLWRCNLPWAAKVRLVGSGRGMRIILDWIGRRLTAERRARCSVK